MAVYGDCCFLPLQSPVLASKDRREELREARAANEAKVTTYLALFGGWGGGSLCDKLLLRDNCDQDIVGKIKYILTAQPTALKPEHLRAAARLPSGHGNTETLRQGYYEGFRAS